MEKFTNTNIIKEGKRLKRNVLLCVLLLVIAVGLAYWAYQITEGAHKNVKTLNEIIVSEDENKENKIATLNVQGQPYQFAVQEGNEDSYYILIDDKYMYIAYLSPYMYNYLNVETITKEPLQIEGTTKLISREIKKLALEAYNEGVDEDKKLTMADFNSYFGEVYLDATATGDDDIAFFQEFGFFLCLAGGIIGLCICGIQKIRFNRSIKKMDEDLIYKLDNEMDASSAFYYEKIHLYLTDNYIINFGGGFKVIEYKDIIWMYSMVYRTNGIKTNQSIKVMTKNGKTHEIAVVSMVTKAKKEIYNEIWNTIVSKNNSIVLGFTKEAKQQAKELIEK